MQMQLYSEKIPGRDQPYDPAVQLIIREWRDNGYMRLLTIDEAGEGYLRQF